MPSGQLEPRQPHGSRERKPGTLVRAMGEFALSKGLFPSKESLAHKLCQDLKSCGVIYHVRTLKRQISGFIALERSVCNATSRSKASRIQWQLLRPFSPARIGFSSDQ